MSSDVLIQEADQPVAAWRGGSTRAIYAYPTEMLNERATAHVWVSTATIECDCAYSVFPNRTRVHLPMRGNGLQLHFQQPTETITLSTFAQATFDGERPLDVTLLEGPVEAFNLIFHPTVQARLEVLHLTLADGSVAVGSQGTPSVQTPHVVQLFYAINGGCAVQHGEAPVVTLQAGDAFVCDWSHEITLAGVDGDGDVDLVAATLMF